MQMFPNFELDELVASTVAKKKKIDNTPSFEIVEHLKEFTGNFLQPLRTAYGKAIVVTSGYRCDALNTAVGGVKTSAHKYGWAADLQPADMRNFSAFVSFTIDWVKKNNIPFDQLIIEKSGKTQWLHVGYRNAAGLQRKQILNITVS